MSAEPFSRDRTGTGYAPPWGVTNDQIDVGWIASVLVEEVATPNSAVTEFAIHLVEPSDKPRQDPPLRL